MRLATGCLDPKPRRGGLFIGKTQIVPFLFAFRPRKLSGPKNKKNDFWGHQWLFMTSAISAFLIVTGFAGPIDIGDRRQVFVDRTFLGEAKGLEIVVHPPRKSGEMTIKPEGPWEKGGIGPYSSALFDGATYHLWYHAMDTVQWDAGHTNGCICYATSKDGIRWERPELGLVEYAGSRKNNIVFGHGANGVTFGQDGGMVFLDPNGGVEQRFRMVCRFGAEGEGLRVFSSGDGVHWKLTHPSVMTARPEEKGHQLDSQNVIFWDDALKKYVAYLRYNRPERHGRARSIARGESDRLGGFAVVQDLPVVLQPDDQDLQEDGLPAVDFYMSAAVKYPWAEKAYFMFPTAYYHYSGRLPEFIPQGGRPINAGPLDSQFAASRDGIKWERYDRKPFVALGMKGEFDWACARVVWGLVPDTTGREMYLYYRAGDSLHGWDRNEQNKRILTGKGLGATQNIACLSRLISRRDGFTSVRGAYAGGEFTTPPLVFAGSKLVLNLDTSATGLVRVGIGDEQGVAIEGFAPDRCDIIHTANEINRRVTWGGNADVSKLAGRPVRLKFLVRDADLYAFHFQN